MIPVFSTWITLKGQKSPPHGLTDHLSVSELGRALTSSVSDPPTILRPSPVCPLEISIVVSQPGIMGQVAGSEAKTAGVDDLLVPKKEFTMNEPQIKIA